MSSDVIALLAAKNYTFYTRSGDVLKVEDLPRGEDFYTFCPVHESAGKHDPTLSITIRASDGKVAMHCFACDNGEQRAWPAIASGDISECTAEYEAHGWGGNGGGHTGWSSGSPHVRVKRLIARIEIAHEADYSAWCHQISEGIDDVAYIYGGGFAKVKWRGTLPSGQPLKAFEWFSQRTTGWYRGLYDRVPPLYGTDRIGGADIVYAVEGEKDTDALRERGVAAVSTAYVGLPDMSYLQGKHVVVIPDADEPGAHKARIFALLAAEAGAHVTVSAPLGDRKGYDVSDWLADGNDVAGLPQPQDDPERAADEQARTDQDGAPGGEAWQRGGDSMEFPGSPSNPLMVARTVQRHLASGPSGFSWPALTRETAEACVIRADRGLRYWRGEWYRRAGSHWEPSGAREIEAALWVALGDAFYRTRVRDEHGQTTWQDLPWNPNISKIQNVMRALSALLIVPDAVEMPSWLEGASDRPSHLLPCDNALVEPETGRAWPASPEWFCSWSTGYAHDPGAACPEWDKFLASILPGDDDSVRLLQQWFGYVITGRTDLQKFLFLLGPKRAGKGTVARVLAALLGGSRNVPGLGFSSFSDHFGLSPLPGMPLAVVADARDSGDAHAMQRATERILTITGEDIITIDRKNRPLWNGQLGTRLMLVSNELPRFRDPSGAITYRMLLVHIRESVADREDPQLTRRLLAELPGILNWAIDGARDLAHEGRFTEPASTRMEKLDFDDKASPYAAFVRDRCEVGEGLEESSAYLLAQLMLYCEERELPLSGTERSLRQNLLEKLQAVAPHVRKAPGSGYVRDRLTGQRVRGFSGIKYSGALGDTTSAE